MALVGYCSIKKTNKTEQQATIDSYSALLQDTLEKVTSKKDTYYIQPISTITPEDVYNSDIYQKLSAQQQKQVKELKEKKDLLAALNISVVAQLQENQKLRDSLSVWSVKDTIFMTPDGTLLIFSDTTGDFQYTESIELSDTITRKTDYKLTVRPNLTITKLSKYSVEGQWSFPGLEQEFPDIVISNEFTYWQTTTPKEKRKQTTLKILKITGLTLSHGLIFYGGVKIGQTL